MRFCWEMWTCIAAITLYNKCFRGIYVMKNVYIESWTFDHFNTFLNSLQKFSHHNLLDYMHKKSQVEWSIDENHTITYIFAAATFQKPTPNKKCIK